MAWLLYVVFALLSVASWHWAKPRVDHFDDLDRALGIFEEGEFAICLADGGGQEHLHPRLVGAGAFDRLRAQLRSSGGRFFEGAGK